MSDTDNQDLSKMTLVELKRLAASKGLKRVSALRKSELITAIQTGEVPQKAAERVRAEKAEPTEPTKPTRQPAAEQQAAQPQESQPTASEAEPQQERHDDNQMPTRSQARRARRYKARQHNQQQDNAGNAPESADDSRGADQAEKAGQVDKSEQSERNDNQQEQRSRRDNRDNRDNRRERNNRSNGSEDSGDNRDNGGNQESQNNHNDQQGQNQGQGRRGRRGRRGRNNNHNDNGGNGGNQNNNDNQNNQPDELQDVAGILDVVDNSSAFLRTTGYRASNADVFVNNNLVKRFGLRSGDAIIGQVKMNGAARTQGNGRNRRKFNQLVRVDSVNGMTPDEARQRPEFHKLTPLYPNQRLRLETEPKILTTRVIDLVMPIGKGQRALIVSPPKAGKTTILQNIANAIATNNPECYLMVVLVDERPEEVTDMQRSVKGEVIASTFDRPPSEHTAVAELAIERAKRLAEMGKDVVVLLDSITRLGRAYNNSSPASGRILSGGVDSNALYPPKRFLGAARNIENGGSLTIIATAMVETGSAGDTVIFEEFKGTGNAELKLDRRISERRVFPAVDVNPSGTRKDELLLAPDEARVMHKLRRILSALDSQQAIDLLIKQLKKTKNNGEFLMQIASSAPMAASLEEEDYQ